MNTDPLYEGPPEIWGGGPPNPWTQRTWVSVNGKVRLSYHDNGDPHPIPKAGGGEWSAAKRFHSWSIYLEGKTVERLAKGGLYDSDTDDKRARSLAQAVRWLEAAPNHLMVEGGGVVLRLPEEPVRSLFVKDEDTSAQWLVDVLDGIRDVLGQSPRVYA